MTNSTEVTASGATVTPDLAIVDGQITTTSQQIAEHFGKAHRSVLLAIRRLECSTEFTEHNFVRSEYADVTGRKLPCYRITRDGFVFLAMGFTGKESAQWKEAYITAFNKMEVRLLEQATKAQPVQAALDYDRISPAQAQDLKLIVQAIVDAGIQKYAETWARLQRKFKVHSYLALHPDQYEAARAYLIAKLPNGYAPEVEEDFKQGTLRPFDGVAMRAARQVAMGFMTSTYQAAKAGQDTPPMANLPSDVLTGVLANALVQQRFLAFFNAECCLQFKPMSDGAVVIDFENADLDTIAQAVPMARLAALMEALSRRTQTHLDAFGSYLTRAGGVQLM
ncbi:Rha family transcriptional regulator [Comamonas thiooxydans]|nr:Rha family transcriptional regulator [Comamonas thiooxydans]MDH1743517.1 Rha family transcriptional regulator [Comamonas thiooxydans]